MKFLSTIQADFRWSSFTVNLSHFSKLIAGGRSARAAAAVCGVVLVFMFCQVPSAHANVSGASATPSFIVDGLGVSNSTATVITYSYTVDAADYLAGARYTLVYTCTSFASGAVCNEIDGSESSIDPVTYASQSTLDYSSRSRPQAYGYTAVIERDASHSYMTEYAIHNQFANGGYILYAPNATTTVSTSTVMIVDNPNLDIFLIVFLCVVVFAIMIFFFRNPSYLTRT